MEKSDPRTQVVEKNLFTKLSSLGNEEVDEMERFRKKFNVMEVKIDDIYNHLLSTRNVDPKKILVDKLNISSAALLTVGLAVLLIGLLMSEDLVAFVSIGISAVGLILLYTSVYFQSSLGGKDKTK